MTLSTGPGEAAGTGTERRFGVAGSWWSPGFRSAATRATVAQVLLGITIVAQLIGLVLIVRGFELLDLAERFRLSDQDIDTYVGMADMHTTATGFVFLATAVAFIAWLSRSVDNVPAIGGGTPYWSPRWAIVWWFIPLADLVMPAYVTHDLGRRVSRDRRGHPWLVLAWWLLFIGTVPAAWISEGLVEGGIDAQRDALGIALAVGIINVIDAVLAIVIVRRFQADEAYWASSSSVRELPAPDGGPVPGWPGVDRGSEP